MKLIDIIGQKFNRLTVIKRVFNEREQTHWECLCDCGKITITTSAHLKSNHTRSCGCYQIEVSTKTLKGQTHSRKAKGESGFNILINHYKRGAVSRNLEFSLSKEEFRYLVTQNCYYCNRKPTQESLGKAKHTEAGKEHSTFLYNGLDRINNDKGYTLDNVLTSCKRDNFLRSNRFTVEETKVMVDALEKFHNEN